MHLLGWPDAFKIIFKGDAPLARGEPILDVFLESFQAALSGTYAGSLLDYLRFGLVAPTAHAQGAQRFRFRF